ncbi:hypothetical protein [Pseudidiomarina sp.]|uniref:hypothetical protein n=1 Tax=Pseudidiomarina sp. TaxID=2081707 RepID=UPI003A9822EF
MHSILIYGFPIILVSFEALLRNLIDVDTFGFVGPTLAATGISFMVPLTRLKVSEVKSSLGEKWVQVSKRDQNYVSLVWLLLFISLFLWFWVCTLSIQSDTSKLFDFPTHVVIGATMYVIGIVLSSIKEVM